MLCPKWKESYKNEEYEEGVFQCGEIRADGAVADGRILLVFDPTNIRFQPQGNKERVYFPRVPGQARHIRLLARPVNDALAHSAKISFARVCGGLQAYGWQDDGKITAYVRIKADFRIIGKGGGECFAPGSQGFA
jgi:hypothetical protein